MIKKWTIGVDEAGRGPLAGPVAVGVVLVPTDFDWGLIPGVGDSKQVSEKNRVVIFKRAQELQKAGQLQYKVGLVSAKIIDQKGIVYAVNSAMKTALDSVLPKQDARTQKPLTPNEPSPEGGLATLKIGVDEVMVKLDGSLRAPVEFIHQETIIKGDSKEKVIGLASIMAKVTRDQYMEKLAVTSEYKMYNFGQHKGYGTKSHREAVSQNGLSTEHRVTYCGNIEFVV